jgi:hypothetical protein
MYAPELYGTQYLFRLLSMYGKRMSNHPLNHVYEPGVPNDFKLERGKAGLSDGGS